MGEDFRKWLGGRRTSHLPSRRHQSILNVGFVVAHDAEFHGLVAKGALPRPVLSFGPPGSRVGRQTGADRDDEEQRNRRRRKVARSANRSGQVVQSACFWTVNFD